MHEIDIDPTQFRLIDDAVQTAFPDAQWTLLTPVGGGLSTSVLYKIAIGEGTYIVRFSDPAHPHNNLTREYDAMRLAAAQKLAPLLYHADIQTGVALMGFVESQPLHMTDANSSAVMDSMARLLRAMHQGAGFQKDMPLAAKVEIIFSQMQPDLAAAALVQQGMAQLRELAPLLCDPADGRPSHCDINPGNLLFDGHQLWLVDWAAAAQENFYFDLACCCNFFFYQSNDAEKAFLQTYFERRLTAQEEAKYAQMRTFVAIYYGMMFIYLSGMQGAPLLTQQAIDTLPSYGQFMVRVGQGQERLDNPIAQQRLGFVYLKDVQSSNPEI